MGSLDWSGACRIALGCRGLKGPQIDPPLATVGISVSSPTVEASGQTEPPTALPSAELNAPSRAAGIADLVPALLSAPWSAPAFVSAAPSAGPPLGLACPMVPPACARIAPPDSDTISASHVAATDAMFAAAGQAANDDDAWSF